MLATHGIEEPVSSRAVAACATCGATGVQSGSLDPNFVLVVARHERPDPDAFDQRWGED